jgi:hypothetical protein
VGIFPKFLPNIKKSFTVAVFEPPLVCNYRLSLPQPGKANPLYKTTIKNSKTLTTANYFLFHFSTFAAWK